MTCGHRNFKNSKNLNKKMNHPRLPARDLVHVLSESSSSEDSGDDDFNELCRLERENKKRKRNEDDEKKAQKQLKKDLRDSSDFSSDECSVHSVDLQEKKRRKEEAEKEKPERASQMWSLFPPGSDDDVEAESEESEKFDPEIFKYIHFKRREPRRVITTGEVTGFHNRKGYGEYKGNDEDDGESKSANSK